MEIKNLSNVYHVRKLGIQDVELIYALMYKNDIFYQYHPPFVTRESILEDMEALPPGKGYDDKLYIGFFQGARLIAIMDLILDYPAKETAFIGLFMTDTECQNRGVGSGIIGECAAYLRTSGYKKIRVGVDKGNPQSNAFWRKNGFMIAGENQYYIIMEYVL